MANRAPASIYVPLYVRFVFVLCLGHRPSSVGGETAAVLWAGLTGENKPRPIRTRESVYTANVDVWAGLTASQVFKL